MDKCLRYSEGYIAQKDACNSLIQHLCFVGWACGQGGTRKGGAEESQAEGTGTDDLNKL